MRKKAFITITILFLVLIVPITLFLLSKRQDTRSRATTDSVAISFSPASTEVVENTDFDVVLSVNTQNNPINTVQFTLAFDKDLLTLTEVITESSDANPLAFDPALLTQPDNSTGTYVYKGTGKAHGDVTGASVDVVILKFHSKSPTSNNSVAELGITEAEAGGVGQQPTPVVKYPVTFEAASYTILAESECDTDNGRPDGCECETADQCSGNSICEAGVCVDNPPVSTSTPVPTATSTPVPTATSIPTATPTTTVIPTATSYPTPTIGAGERLLKINAELIGINTDENRTPIHPQRKANIKLYNENRDLVKDFDATVNLDTSDYRYKALLGLGDYTLTGVSVPHLAKVKLGNTISKQSSGILLISTASATTGVYTETLISGDINNDNELSILDYNLMIECIKNSICDADTSGQKYTDFNDDGIVSASDLNILYLGFASRRGE